MITRNRMLAVSSSAALVAGGLFFTTAPAHAAPSDAAACSAAVSNFEAALDQAGADAQAASELGVALQAVLTAQANLDALEGQLLDFDVDAILELGEAEANLQAAIDAFNDNETLIDDLNLDVQAALDNLDLDTALSAAVSDRDVAATSVANLQVEVQDLFGDDVDLDAFLTADIEQLLVDSELDAGLLDQATTLQANLNTALDVLATEQAELDNTQAAVDLVATGDVDAILSSNLDIEGLLGIDLSALATLDADLDDLLELRAGLQADVDEAQADVDLALELGELLEDIGEAQVNVEVAIAAVNDLDVDLDDVGMSIADLEALYTASIVACAGDDIDVDVVIDIDDSFNNNGNDVDADKDIVVDKDDNGTGGGAAGGDDSSNDDDDDDYTSGAGGTGGSSDGTNKGLNVQTAAPAASASTLGLGALLLAGLGGLAAAGTWLRRKA